MAQDVLAVARELAEEVLFPDAMRVDRLDVLPVAHLDALAACRARLDAALGTDPAPMADARAAASELAVRAAAALAVRDGGYAVAVDQHAQRLAREAVFLLVFGSRPGIKSALLQRLGAVALTGR